MSTFLLSQLLAALAFAAGLAAFQFRARPAILRSWSLCAALNGVHFLLLGVPGAATLAGMISVRFLIASFTGDRRIMVFFMILAVAGFLATYTRPVGFLALAATLLGTWASFQPNDRTVRATLAVCASLWVVHNAIIGSPVATAMELSFLASNAIGWRRFHGRAKMMPAHLQTVTTQVNPGDRTAIERFVRDTLGCQCPDEVFQHMEVGPLPLPAGGATGRRLVIGDRLLIHIVTAPEQADLPGWIENLAVAGRDERDRLAYNRYRLVVGSTVEKGGRESLEQRFTRVLKGDDRAHLHWLAANELPVV